MENPTPGSPRTRSRKGVVEGEVEHLPYPLPGHGVEKDLRPLPLGLNVW